MLSTSNAHINVACYKCDTGYEVLQANSGRWARCGKCKTRFVLPFDDEEKLLQWSATVKWMTLVEFLKQGCADQLSESSKNNLMSLYHFRRNSAEAVAAKAGGDDSPWLRGTLFTAWLEHAPLDELETLLTVDQVTVSLNDIDQVRDTYIRRKGEELLSWAEDTDWNSLRQFVTGGQAVGYPQQTVDKLTHIYEIRRAREEGRIHRELEGDPRYDRKAMAFRQKFRQLQRTTIDELRVLQPYQFDRFVANLFDVQGFHTKTVGGRLDRGFDIEIRDDDHRLWGVADCRRYAASNRIGIRHIEALLQAVEAAKAPRGFFFSTGYFTDEARQAAKTNDILQLYDADSLLAHIQALVASLAMRCL